MEIKIKDGNGYVDAEWTMEDGVMVVSPKETRVDVSQFKDGDVITCGWNSTNKSYRWTSILHGDIEYISDNMFIGDYCSLDCRGVFLDHNSNSDSATWVRYATEKEKKKLFDKLKEEGLEWDAERKELVKIKWKPKEGCNIYYPSYNTIKANFITLRGMFNSGRDKDLLDKDWLFKTEQESQEFCNRLNDAINSVKP